jgi:hypothetical protein
MPAADALPPSIASAASLLALLEWQIVMGADAAIGEIAVDRLAPPARAPQPAPLRPAASAPAIVAPPNALAESLAEAAQSARLLAAGAETIEALGALVAGFDHCP